MAKYIQIIDLTLFLFLIVPGFIALLAGGLTVSHALGPVPTFKIQTTAWMFLGLMAVVAMLVSQEGGRAIPDVQWLVLLLIVAAAMLVWINRDRVHTPGHK